MICERVRPNDSLITISLRSTSVSPCATFTMMYGVDTSAVVRIGPSDDTPNTTRVRIARPTIGVLTTI